MKKIVVFFLGVLTGFIIAYFLDNSESKFSLKSLFGSTDSIAVIAPQNPVVVEEPYIPPKTTNKAITLFEKPGEIIGVKVFEVRRVLNDGSALAKQDEYPHDLEALFLNDQGQTYYDNQRIQPGSGKCFRQIGIYKYTEYTQTKTIPVVAIMKR